MQDRYETLLKIPSGRFFGKMFEHEGFIYAPGKPWIRMNPETLEMEILEDKQRRHIRWELIAGRSEHFGMILWNDKGKFFQALESDAKTMSTMSYESNVRGAAASKQIETLQPVVNACYRYRNACGLWPDDLSALVPTYLPAVPANMTYSNWRSGRTILELNRKSNKRQKRDRVAFCFDPHEEGWFRIDAKNIQMPLIGPPIPMLDSLTDSPAVVGAAIREFEARIAKTPDDEVLRTLQLEYLLAHEQADSALQAALNWVYDFPGSAGARQG
ncbi:MAG: hypothetical protein IPK83_23330 [Planctomycetes bacterium]|nr:hypothetical protein [Planctomycetota bacterium]